LITKAELCCLSYFNWQFLFKINFNAFALLEGFKDFTKPSNFGIFEYKKKFYDY